MSAVLIGKMPYLAACKEKYEGYPPEIYAYGERIYGYKNIYTQSFNVNTLEHEPSAYTGYYLKRSERTDPRVPDNMKITKLGYLPKTIEESTLARGPTSCWSYGGSKDYYFGKPALWELRVDEQVVETFVSRSEPQILEVEGMNYIVVETWDRGHDIYRLVPTTQH